MPKWPKKHPETQKYVIWRQKRFLRSKSLFEQKVWKLAQKCEKGENGLQNTKKSIVYRGVGAMGAKLTLPKPKSTFLQIYALLRPKRVFALFPVLSVKRAQIRSWAILGPKMLDIPKEKTALRRRVIFVKMLFGEEKVTMFFLCATWKIWQTSKKWKCDIHTFRPEAQNPL